MLTDKETMFSNNQAITEDAYSTNVVDIGRGDAGKGTPKNLLIQVTETFAGLASIAVTLQTCNDSTFSSGVVNHQTVTITGSNAVAGYKIGITALPEGSLRYARLSYDVTNSTTTTGTGGEAVTTTDTITAGKIAAALVASFDQGW